MIMRKVLFLLLVFTTLTCKAQDTEQEKHEYYCQITYTPLLHYILLPETKEYKSLTDKDGELIKFNNLPHVLNFMTERGWKIVKIDIPQVGHADIIFMKNIINEDKAKEGLYFGDYPYKKKKK